ncbi:MAG: hypothetical protein M0Z80_05885 [Treponema sp.]|nr:hypothetical protein [Treponema sp.]
MKTWLGTLSRACIEFLLALLLVGGAGALDASLRTEAPRIVATFREGVSSMLLYMPLAGLMTLFLSFFTVESRVPNRGLGWLALIVVALLPLTASVGLGRFPLVEELRQSTRPRQAAAAAAPLRADMALERGPLVVWIGAWKGDTAIDAVGADFSSSQPRLVYAPSAPFDPSRGVIFIGSRAFPAALSPARPIELLPEAGALNPWWIWDRLADPSGASPLQALAAALGFGLLAASLRFLARLSSWTLANAFLAAAGLLGVLVLDAFLAGPEAGSLAAPLLGRLGLHLSPPLFMAGAEAALGILIGLVDTLRPGAARRRFDA